MDLGSNRAKINFEMSNLNLIQIGVFRNGKNMNIFVLNINMVYLFPVI